MPNNRPLAVNRLNGLLRTLNRKPKMKDYFQFMGKVFERDHAVPVPQDELLTPNDHSHGRGYWNRQQPPYFSSTL